MKDNLKWLGRQALVGVLWVFILSVTVQGRTVFSHAHDVLIQNPIVENLDRQLAELWTKLYNTAKVTITEFSKEERKI